MMKIYQGVDLVDIPKFRRVFDNHGDFASDVFTDRERAYCLSKRDPHIHFAGRFAVKEASLKALGTGLSGIDHSLREIEIIPGASGRPVLLFSGWVERLSKKRKIHQKTVSISHAETYAVATVILTGE